MKIKNKVKNKNPYKFLKDKNFSLVLEIYFQINFLKHLYRQGWLRHIDEGKCESVADHIFGTAILAILINDYYRLKLDLHKIVMMVLFHEMGEVYTGDITPLDDISKKEKHKLEKNSILKLFKGFPDAQSYIEVWEEFEEQKTKEAKFVLQVEKLEMAAQKKVYEALYEKDMSEFQTYCEKIITGDILKELLNQL